MGQSCWGQVSGVGWKCNLSPFLQKSSLLKYSEPLPVQWSCFPSDEGLPVGHSWPVGVFCSTNICKRNSCLFKWFGKCSTQIFKSGRTWWEKYPRLIKFEFIWSEISQRHNSNNNLVAFTFSCPLSLPNFLNQKYVFCKCDSSFISKQNHTTFTMFHSKFRRTLPHIVQNGLCKCDSIRKLLANKRI